MRQREEQFEAMLQAVLQEYESTVQQLETLRNQDKTKTATYQQLLGNKLQLQNLLARYRAFGLIDERRKR